MAEAHQAVAFSFAVTHEGVHINYDQEVLKLVWTSGVRSYKKRFAKFLNNVKNGVFPSSLEFLALILVFVIAARFIFNVDTSLGFIDLLNNKIIEPFIAPKISLSHSGCILFASIIYGISLWVLKAMLMKYTFKLLLMYKGWMYEFRGPKGASIWTKLWVVTVKALTSRKNVLLYSYQGSLPRLPVPAVHDTMTRYLRSIRPLCETDEKYQRLVKMADDFEKGIAKKLQRYLVLKSWWASNYVSDWWEEYVYLRGRSPIMVNSNFYGMDALLVNATNRQASRAANIVYASLLFRRMIDRQELKPMMIQGMVPLCSWQYERVFNTTRIPGRETDRLHHLDDSQHIVVMSRGKFYKVDLYYKSKLLQPTEIERLLEKIIADESPALPGEQHLGALTAIDRVTWAETRSNYFTKGINRVSLGAIENAIFVLALDEEEIHFNNSEVLSEFGRTLLHGRGHDRWFDKSFTLVISKNGKAGFNAEHSWADAPIMAHYWEYVLSFEDATLGYTEDGRCKVGNGCQPPAPLRLKWDFSPELVGTIDSALKTAQGILEDVDLVVTMFDTYGKGFIKNCKVSPDAYIQLALQLAYYRDAGKLCLTYEASMTRLYREGRTETVRPVTIESAAFVKSMDDPNKTNEERRALMKQASAIHQKGYQDAMCGKGIDRHLFCLYVISKYLEVDSPFLKEVLSEPWKLSTSQTPHGQAGLIDIKKHPNHISAGGGFGPVADDGYGVSYIVAGEDIIFFHISSKRSSPETDSSRFTANLKQALADLRSLFESAGPSPSTQSSKKEQ